MHKGTSFDTADFSAGSIHSASRKLSISNRSAYDCEKLMKIYLINLDRDSQRLAWMDAQFKARNLEYERSPAWTPETVPEHLAQRFHKRASEILLPNNIACFASHLAVAEKLLASEEPYCLVLEDDVEILCSAEEIGAIGAKCCCFDMLKLNDWPKTPTLEIDTAGEYRIIRYHQVPRGTGAYFLSRKGAEKILRRAVQLAISTDNFIRAEAYLHLDIAGVMPPPIPQDRFGASSLDPQKVRSKTRNKRYFYEAPGRGGGLIRAIRMAKQIGTVNYARLELARVIMKANGVKRDHRSQYVLKTKRNV
jgi:glycosyl transferase family 25